MSYKKLKRRISNRRHEPRTCKNPLCGKTFIPDDSRKLFCNPQCKIDYNNDLRKIRNLATDELVRIISKNDFILGKIYNAIAAATITVVDLGILNYEGYNLPVFGISNKNQDSGNFIYWQINYGLEGLDPTTNTFIIHKK